MAMDRARGTGEPVADGTLEPLMTAHEVARILGVNRKFVYARQRSGALRGYKMGPHFRFRRADVEAFLEASLATTEAPIERPRALRRSAPAGTFRALLDRTAA
jgi:excisionase family DNA binding protein